MAATINAPIAWETATGDDLTMLNETQANILHSHVRDNLSVLFLQFGNQADARTLLVALAQQLMKSARTHLNELKQFKATGAPGTPYVGVGLTRTVHS